MRGDSPVIRFLLLSLSVYLIRADLCAVARFIGRADSAISQCLAITSAYSPLFTAATLKLAIPHVERYFALLSPSRLIARACARLLRMRLIARSGLCALSSQIVNGVRYEFGMCLLNNRVSTEDKTKTKWQRQRKPTQKCSASMSALRTIRMRLFAAVALSPRPFRSFNLARARRTHTDAMTHK